MENSRTSEQMDQAADAVGRSVGRQDARREAVNHPPHYGGGDNPYEAIKVIEAWKLGFCLGNVVKYIARAEHKNNTLEDLKKARWYLDRRIQQLTGSVRSD